MLQGTGWRKQELDERDYTIDHPRVRHLFGLLKSVSLPSSVDLRYLCPPVEDQGDLGSCTAHSAIGAMELLERKIYNTHTDLSRLFTYYVSRVLEGTVDYDSGATIRNSVKSLVKYGTPRESIWPYNIGNYKVNPSTDCYTEASTLQAVTYVALYSLDDIKTALYGGLPVDFGFNVYDSIYDTDLGVIPYPTPTEDLLGGHAVLAVGYDDDKVITNHRNGSTTTGALLIRNSWGTTWGEYGYGWLPYQYVEDGLADDFWCILTREYLEPAPVPVDPEPSPEPVIESTFWDMLIYYIKQFLRWLSGRK